MDRADPPKAVHQGSLTLAGVAIRTYVLDDGRRIMSSDDIHDLFKALEAGATLTPEEAQAYARFVGRGSEWSP